jgi:hypothetical protein
MKPGPGSGGGAAGGGSDCAWPGAAGTRKLKANAAAPKTPALTNLTPYRRGDDLHADKIILN